MARKKKWIYAFEEGRAEMRMLLGNKGANLAEMTNLDLPVPPGFTITTEACREYYRNGQRLPEGLEDQIKKYLSQLEKKTGKGFGDPVNPLLVSVRSGAPASMPGMMDTILNLGLNDQTVQGLISQTGDERFAWDSYRRFIQMFGNVVLDVSRDKFEHILDQLKERRAHLLGKPLDQVRDTDLTVDDLKEAVQRFKELIASEKGQPFPDDPYQQLMMAVEAVFHSWNNPRAISYRRINNIPHDLGTGVNVQAMVFGNRGWDSGTGVGFTRDPASGKPGLYADYLPNAQGEDVVAGVRTPMDIAWLAENMPAVHQELLRHAEKLERHYLDMQDIEFTVEKGRLYVLQTRTGKRTGPAAIRIAVDMVHEGLITTDQALKMVDARLLEQLLHPQFEPGALAGAEKLATGIAASPGAASGRVTFTAEEAVQWAKQGERVILVRRMTSPDDIDGMHAAKGILTSEGGRTSHAAVVARAMGKTCVVGCRALAINYAEKFFSVNGTIVREGDYISIDGTNGVVYKGDIPVVPSEIVRVVLGDLKPEESPLYRYYEEFMTWVDQRRKLGTQANADKPEEARLARLLGAEGIGLARTEHMFFDPERLPHFQRLILADHKEEREEAMKVILPFQRQDFYGLLKEMDGLPVIIRLLDPPLHEFLPHTEQEAKELAEKLGLPFEDIWTKSLRLHENNPMLGHRGCRLGVTFPEIYQMQTRAIMEAACQLKKEGFNPKPKIEIPLVGHHNELIVTRKYVEEEVKRVIQEQGVTVEYQVGTMIEIPRACLTADKIAQYADFFSFGTNDLTQTTFGFSRDDVEGKFMADYLEEVVGMEGTPILRANPFEVLDPDGVGELMRICVEKGRSVKPDLEIGICGEHGGEPNSVWFCHDIGLNYVSCSAFRVPVARLAAAQAVIREEERAKAKARVGRRKKQVTEVRD
ncbi:MAG: pyruvate, phosphate dikinase [Armatimonadetes bacterium]|nr:pyruvate, phosphate dikinase [Armatimonadota bacterium]MDW8122631.1 pyruvate, phosphate dikinase [Armatimonadota bacterium]